LGSQSNQKTLKERQTHRTRHKRFRLMAPKKKEKILVTGEKGREKRYLVSPMYGGIQLGENGS